MDPLVDGGSLTSREARRLLSNATHAPKLGVINDGQRSYVVLYKAAEAKKPFAAVRLEHILELLMTYLPDEPDAPDAL